MDSDQGKLFIGGISWETTEDKLKEHFENYGEVAHTVIMRDKDTQRPRGFGFVTFGDPSVLDRVLQDSHNIDGRTVEAKRAMSREEQQVTRSSNPNPTRGYGSGGNVRTKKIFVGGLPATLTEEEFRQYFETYGHVTDVVVMYDQNTQRPRGFGFISFDNEDAVERVLHKTFHDLNGKQVEVKRALPKDANMGGSGQSMGGNAGGGGYQGYGSSGGSQNAYGGRMESNRYMQPQSAVGGFPYGSTGFNASGYGYGPAGNGMGYGAYGAYGGANPVYGGPAAAYGNPGVPSPGYAGGPPGAPRNSWAAQGGGGYGTVGYGNVSSWSAPNPGSAPGNVGPGPTGQSPNGTSVYSAQGYGYGGYGVGDGSYPGSGAYGGVSGRSGNVPNSNAGGSEMQGSGGYGYSESGYGNAGWRSDPSQAPGNYGAQAPGPQGSYGSGYAGTPARQPQQQ